MDCLQLNVPYPLTPILYCVCVMAKLPGLSRLAVEDCRKLVDDTCGTCKAHMTGMQISADGEALPWEPHENSKVVSIVVCFCFLFKL